MKPSYHDCFDCLRDVTHGIVQDRDFLWKIVSSDTGFGLYPLMAISERAYVDPFFLRLLQSLENARAEVEKERSVADWPFENFWANPYEPAHSKLLGYFIDPTAPHGCGSFLLRSLLDILSTAVDQNHCFPARSDNCLVETETRDEHGQVDIWVSLHEAGRKYAIIIENKINEAENQDDQLTRYVKRAEHRGFCTKNEIFVFFLPLIDNVDPDHVDRETIERDGRATYAKVTFDVQIRQWIRDSLQATWTPNMELRLRAHLSYYGLLLDHLIKKKKIMDTEILSKLRASYRTEERLPSLSSVAQLRSDAEVLERCLKHVLGAKLLLAVQQLLPDAAWLCEENQPTQITGADPFDRAFQRGMNVCVEASPAVAVCFGCSPYQQPWFGYMSRDRSMDETMRRCTDAEAKRFAENVQATGAWYAYFSIVAIKPNTLSGIGLTDERWDDASIALSIKDNLLKMRDGLLATLRTKQPQHPDPIVASQ